MNRFMPRKKVKERQTNNDHALPLEQHNSAHNLVNEPTKKQWGWRKKQPEPKPEIDLATVLPSQDNFRTSLIMPNLSARFSMLKEQDDPASILGKASDDSVLQAKRRSRLGDFGYPNKSLADIAEVSSVNDLTRPTLAPLRQGSYTFGEPLASDDDSLNGSIMSRSRPEKGNILFGGRQKIYRIPVGDQGAVSNLGTGESRGMRGRALYEDDVSMSSFQKIREEQKRMERERQLAEMEHRADDAKEGPNSLSFSAYNDKRDTVSSTNSGPSMVSASTAPTSVNSHGANSPGLTSSIRSNSPSASYLERQKSRRLYEPGLDQHFQDQQSSALSRMHSFNKQGASGGRSASSHVAKMVSSLSEAEDKATSVASKPDDHYNHDPVGKLPTFHSTQSNRLATSSSADRLPLHPKPFSPHDEEGKTMLTQALDPRDRGKATAMGTFNKPQQFSEEQYLQRQMSLAQQRSNQSNDTAASKYPVSRKPLPQRPSNETSRPSTRRTDRSWSDSSTKNESATFSLSKDSSASTPTSSPSKRRGIAAPTETFLAEDGDYENEAEARVHPPADKETEDTVEEGLPSSQSTEAPSSLTMTHPAMRSPTSPQSKKEKRNAWSPDALKSAVAGSPTVEDGEQDHDKATEEAVSKPSNTEDGAGLRGLVREHLRHPSNQSSIYPPKSPVVSEMDFEYRAPSIYSVADPYDGEARRDGNVNDFQSSLAIGNPYSNASAQQRSPTLQELISRESDASGADWERELSKQHARAGSSETQHEREAFASELAQRQKTIQENLKIRVGNDRSPSPKDTNRNVFESTIRPFGMLRTKSSRDAMAVRPDIPSKSARGLGMAPGQSTPINGPDRALGENVRPNSPRDRPAVANAVGRTLHSRLPPGNTESSRAGRPSEESGRPSGDGLRPRRSSIGQDRQSPLRESPPDSSRTSSSRNRSSSNTSLDAHPSQPTLRQREEFAQKIAESDSRVKGFRFPNNSSSPRPSNDRNGVSDRGGKDFFSLKTEAPHVSKAGNNSIRSGASPTDPTSSSPPLSSVSTPNFGSAPSTSNSQQHGSVSNGLQTLPHSPTSAQSFPSPSILSSKEVSTKDKDGSGFFSRGRKATIQKGEISEPTLLTSTSNMDTVDLPQGASLRNGLRDDFDVVLNGGAAPAPTVPTNSGQLHSLSTAKKMGAWFSRERRPSGPKSAGQAGLVSPKMSMDNKNSTDDNSPPAGLISSFPPGGRLRIRKISSEDGGLNDRRARHQVVRVNSDGPDHGERDGLGGMI